MNLDVPTHMYGDSTGKLPSMSFVVSPSNYMSRHLPSVEIPVPDDEYPSPHERSH